MKRLPIILGLCLLVATSSGIFASCKPKGELPPANIEVPKDSVVYFNGNEWKTLQVYPQAKLSNYTDEEIQSFIDEYYEKSMNQCYLEYHADYAQIIQVYQNELVLRELRRINEK